VPPLDANGDGNNDFAGQKIDVRFDRGSGADSRCLPQTYTMQIENSGAVVVDPQTSPRPLRARPREGRLCHYDVSYSVSNTGPGSSSVGRVVLAPGATQRISPTSPFVVVAEFTSRTAFQPSVTVTVPQTQDTPDGTNDHSGQRINIEFSRTTGISSGCTANFSVTYEVADDGSVGLAQGSTLPTMTDQPAGQTGRCVYTAALPNRVGDLALQGSVGRTVYAGSPRFAAAYSAVTTHFTPAVAITVPQVNDDGDTANDLSGTNLEVTFTRVSGSNNGCTQTATVTTTIADDGTAPIIIPTTLADDGITPIATPTTLVNRPQGANARCRYDVAFEATVGMLTLQPGSTTVLDATSPTATATYFAATSSFMPAIGITVPQISDNDPAVNDYSGTEFDLTFTPVSGADSGCTQTATGTATVADDGTVPTTTQAMLVNRPTGVDVRCQYDVAWPSMVEDLTLQPGSTSTVDVTSLTATATYHAPTSTFMPAITINVPQISDNDPAVNDYSGTNFEVRFTRVSGANAGCSQTVFAVVAIDDDGNSAVIGSSTITDGNAVSSLQPPTLVNRPTGVDTRCQYDIAFQSTVGDLTLQPGFTAMVDAITPVAATYHAPTSNFTPTISITVPDIDDDNDDDNDLSGITFDITFTPVSGADSGCTQTATATATVADDGTVPTTTQATLVNRPSGVDARCLYDVALPNGKAFSNMTRLLVLEPGATATVNAVSAAVTAVYTAPEVFSPAITIAVPDRDRNIDNISDFSGAEFEVVFTPVSGADSRCDQTVTSTATVTIGDDGNSSVTTDAILVDRPASGAARCRYDVTFPSAITLPNMVLVLVLQPGSTAMVDSASPTAMAAYETMEVFAPVITITVPQTDENTPGTNDHTGAIFRVTFTPVSGAHRGCTQTATSTVTIDDDGNSAVTTPVILVNRPIGVGTRCQYDVTFPTPVGVLALQTGTAATVVATRPAVTASYAVSDITRFAPTFTIGVPQRDHDNSGANDHTGTKIRVTFTPVMGADSGCTQSAIATVTIDDDGNTPVTSPITLINQAAGVSTSCQYDVAFPDMAGALVLQPGATTMVDNTSPGASATYFATEVLTPTITITVPQQNQFHGTRFEVIFARTSEANNGCTRLTTAIVTIGSDGNSVLTTPATLVDRPIGVSARCQYRVVFPTPVGQLQLQSGATAMVDGGNATATATYTTRTSTTFSPTPPIIVPTNDSQNYAGATFSVVYLPVVNDPLPIPTIAWESRLELCFLLPFDLPMDVVVRQCLRSVVDTTEKTDSGCTRFARAIVTIAQDETSSVTTPATLVDRPPGVNARCQYRVVFPAHLYSSELPNSRFGQLRLVRRLDTSPTGDTVSATSRSSSATYISGPAQDTYRYRPAISIAVSQIDADGNGVNDLAGQAISVRFTRVRSSIAACSSTSLNMVVDNDGSVVFVPADPPRIYSVEVWGRRGNSREPGESGNVECEYDVQVTRSGTGEGATSLGRMGLVSATSRVSPNSPFVVARFTSPTGFQPVVNIVVPQADDAVTSVNDRSGERFTVGFSRMSGPTSGCTGNFSSVFEVGDDGSVALAQGSTLRTLLLRPAGQTANCVYSVTLPDRVGDLVLQPGATATVGDDSRVVSAVYHAPTTRFAPGINIAVPQVDVDASGANDFSGTAFRVAFARVAGSHSGCTQSAAATATIADDGSVPVTTQAMLVNRPSGIDTRCRYTVSLPNTVGGLTLQPGATVTVDAGRSRVVSATYFAPTLNFSPAVDIGVPQINDDGDDANDFSGVSFNVVFTSVAGSNTRCTPTAAAVATIADDGTVPATEVTLVSNPVGVDTRCRYAVSIPNAVGGLILQPGFTTVVSGASPTVAATYFSPTSNFAPSVAIAVPQTDDNTAGINDYSGTEFQVAFTRAAGSHGGCTQTAAIVVAIGDDGSSEVTTPASLVNRPYGVDARCRYDVALPPTVGDLFLLPGFTAVMDAVSPVAAAYHDPAKPFAPAVVVTVPQIA